MKTGQEIKEEYTVKARKYAEKMHDKENFSS